MDALHLMVVPAVTFVVVFVAVAGTMTLVVRGRENRKLRRIIEAILGTNKRG